MTDRTDTLDLFERLAQALPDPVAPPPRWSCPDCEDRGWVVQDDRTARMCVCRQSRLHEPLDRSHALAFAGAPKIVVERPFVAPKAWADRRLEEWTGEPWCVLLCGPPGTGKTMVASELFARVVCQPGVRPRKSTWLRAAEVPRLFFGATGEGAESREGRAAAWASVMTAPAVLLDDLGRGHPGGGWEPLSQVVQVRESQQLPTLLTTNLRPHEIERADPSLWDRVQTGIVAPMVGASQRRRT